MYPALKKKALLLALFFVVVISTAAAETAAKFTDWQISLAVSSEGYAAPGYFDEDVYAGISIGWEPFQFLHCDPMITAGILFNGGAESAESVFFQTGVVVELFSLHKHPLSVLFTRPSTMTPALEFSLIIPNTGFDDLNFRLGAAPLRFSFGYGSVSLFEPQILLNSDFSLNGWGVRLFSFTNYIW